MGERLAPLLGFLIIGFAIFGAIAAFNVSGSVGRSIETKSQQAALDRQQFREMNARAFEDNRIVREQSAQARANTYRALRWLAPVGAAFVILPLSAGLGVATLVFLVGYGTARARRENFKARLIYPDKSTGLFPILPYTLCGQLRLHNPNTGSVVTLGELRQENSLLVAASGLTQASGVIAQYAAKSNDPAGVALVAPPIVRGTVIDGQ